MNDCFEILNDVLLIATFQSRSQDRLRQPHRRADAGPEWPRAMFGRRRRLGEPERR